MARVTGVEAEKGLVHCSIGMPFDCPGLDKGWVASNEEGTKFWRADYLGGSRADHKYSFRLSGAPVSMDDFGREKGFRLWEYGVGDTVRQSTYASVRRVADKVYEFRCDVDVAVAFKAKGLMLSSDLKEWQPAVAREVNGKVQTAIRVDALRDGRIYMRLQ